MAGETKAFPTAVTALETHSTFSEDKYGSANGENFLIGYDAEKKELGLLDTCPSDSVASNVWLRV